MSCMKCGKAIEDGQAFCARCLEVMEDYPVKPDVHIQLPVHSAEESNKKPSRKKRRERSVAGLRKQIGWMWAVIVLLMLALAFSWGREAVHPGSKAPGQNYTYTEPTT